MLTFSELWQRFGRVNVCSDKELFPWIVAICSHALSSGEMIPNGTCTGATLKLGREFQLQVNWSESKTPADATFNTQRRWLLTWFMNALNPKDGEDVAAVYKLCMNNAQRLQPKARW